MDTPKNTSQPTILDSGTTVCITVLLVQIDGALSGLVTDSVAVCQVLSNDAGSWFLLLGDFIAVTLSLCVVVASIILGRTSSASDLDLGGAQLGVVEEESSLGRGFLFEVYGGFLSLASGLDLDTGNLATVAQRS